MAVIIGERLDLVPATVALLEAELASFQELGRLLGATVPPGWPPGEYDRSAMEFFLAQLRQDPADAGWYGWYAILHAQHDEPTLVGAAGYFGPPNSEGSVEIGYSIVPAYLGRGYATEIVGALVGHAWSTPAVRRVVAHTDLGNAGSTRVLEKCGFAVVEQDRGSGTITYERKRRDGLAP